MSTGLCGNRKKGTYIIGTRIFSRKEVSQGGILNYFSYGWYRFNRPDPISPWINLSLRHTPPKFSIGHVIGWSLISQSAMIMSDGHVKRSARLLTSRIGPRPIGLWKWQYWECFCVLCTHLGNAECPIYKCAVGWIWQWDWLVRCWN